MSKKDKKKKKVSVKKERYAKFHRDKPGALDISFPDLSDDQMKQKKEDETKLERFSRYNRNKPAKEVVERRALSKRARIKK